MSMAYDLAEAGPASSQFGYALSLVACDMVARTRGPQALAGIYAGLAVLGPDAMSDEQDAVYRQVTGLGSAALARRAAMMVGTFRSQ